MIPFLLPSDALSFKGSGYGALTKAISCTVKQELGSTGVYELEMEILTDDPNFQNMEIGKIITAKPNLTDENQAFVIESMSKPINNVVSVYATHIAQHRARLIPVAPVTATDLQDALSKIIANSTETNPFVLHSERTTATAYTTDTPRSFREILGGSEGSLLDVYGGEYIFNNLDIELVNKRGRSNGVQVVYGQNMTDFQLDEEFSYSQTITGILPYWYSEEDGLVQGSVQYSDYVDYFKYHKTIAKDYSEYFENKPTSAQLEAKALSDVSKLGFPSTNIKVAFNEFNDVIKGNTMIMQLGDEVRVINSNYGVNTTARICSMTFNVLANRYDEIQVGSLQQTINDAISDTASVNVTQNNAITYTAGMGISILDNTISNSLPFYIATGAVGATTSLPSNRTITKVALTRSLVSNGTGFSISDGGIKVANAGKYLICGSLYFKTATGVTEGGVYIKSGTAFGTAYEQMSNFMPNPNSSAKATGTKIAELAANDIVYLAGRSSGGNATGLDDDRATYLQVIRLT